MEGQARVGGQLQIVALGRRQQGRGAVADGHDAQFEQFGHGRVARHVTHLELIAGRGAVRASRVVTGALEKAGVGEERDRLADDAGGRSRESAGVLGGAGGAAPCVDPPGGLKTGGVGRRVGVLPLRLGALLQPAAGLPYERVDAVDRDPADVTVVGEILGAGNAMAATARWARPCRKRSAESVEARRA